MPDKKTYDQGFFYIVDDVEISKRGASWRRDDCRVQDMHQSKCDAMRALFQKYSDYEVHGVTLPARSRPKQFYDYFQRELSTKSPDDLIIIYFHGGAGHNDKDYTW